MQTFKVGDWIVEPNGNKVRLNEVPELGSYYAEDCVLWQPQPGECEPFIGQSPAALQSQSKG